MGIKVFVYGSLKKGFCNHARFLDEATFLGETRTHSRAYKMYSFGMFPAVYKGGAYSIEGELYEVTEEELVHLDRLESNGRFYNREEVKLANGETAWMYLCMGKPYNGDMSRIKNTRNHSQVWSQTVVYHPRKGLPSVPRSASLSHS